VRPVQSDSYTVISIPFTLSIDLGHDLDNASANKGPSIGNVKGNLNETGFQWHIGSMLVNDNVTLVKYSKTSCLLIPRQY
jgi:hypothetical protein